MTKRKAEEGKIKAEESYQERRSRGRKYKFSVPPSQLAPSIEHFHPRCFVHSVSSVSGFNSDSCVTKIHAIRDPISDVYSNETLDRQAKPAMGVLPFSIVQMTLCISTALLALLRVVLFVAHAGNAINKRGSDTAKRIDTLARQERIDSSFLPLSIDSTR